MTEGTLVIGKSENDKQGVDIKVDSDFYKAIYVTLPFALILYDSTPAHRIIQANEEFYRLIGYTPKQIEEERHNSMTEITAASDLKSFNAVMDNVKPGRSYSRELRFTKRDGGTVWFICETTVLFDKDGNRIYHAICHDNTKERRTAIERENRVKEMRKYDRKSGLYTSTFGEKLIRQYFAKRKVRRNAIMFVVSLDSVQKLADVYGNVFTESMICDVASILMQEADKNMILVRLSEDEILGFIKNGNLEKAVAYYTKTEHIIGGMYTQSQELTIGKCQVGATISETDDFDYMLECAHIAIERAREMPDKRIVYYSEIEDKDRRHAAYSGKQNSKRRTEGKDEVDEITFTHEIFLHSKNTKDAINIVLERMGRRYGYDRVSIVEINKDYGYFAYSFYWDRYAKMNLDDEVIYFNNEEYNSLSQWYTNHTAVEGCEIHNKYALPSVLSTGILERGVLKAVLSISRSETDYEWDDEDRKRVTTHAKAIGGYLLTYRSNEVSREKSEFLSRVSHEMRTPLNVILGMTRLAQEHPEDCDEVKRYLEKIYDSSEYLLHLINGVLDMSRIESGRTELNKTEFSLDSIVERVRMMGEAQVESRNISFIVKTDYRNAEVIGDELRLTQILVNLTANAVKYTDDGGNVIVTITQSTEDEDMFTFRVADNGRGISAEDQKRIFDTFYQGETGTASLSGTGLGLSIASAFVKLMGGQLRVESTLGKGSTFSFTIDMKACSNIKKKTKWSEEESINEGSKLLFGGKRVLIVEDNELNLEILKIMMQKFNAVVDTAANGKIATEKFKASPQGYYDLILMDLRMPVMDGFEATHTIRAMKRRDAKIVPIIAVTANAFTEDEQKSFESGMNGHLSKPILPAALFSVARRLFEQGRQS